MNLSLNKLFKPHTPTPTNFTYFTLISHVTFIPRCSSTLNNNLPRICCAINYNNLTRDNGYFDPTRPTNPATLSKKWMEYQGVHHWAGLLDPLDDILRSEIIRYGGFVEAAYRAFEFDPTSASYGSSVYSKKHFFKQVGLGILGYRMTCNLRANSGIKLPGWAQSSWIAKQSSWIGYVAVSHDRREIARLGRRDVVIAFRGTATCLEWVENLRVTLAPIEAGPPNDAGPPMVETGFLSLYTSKSGSYPSLQKVIRREVGRILDLYPDEPISFTFTGHSLGAALATLAAHDVRVTYKRAHIVTVISYGGPRVGNSSFRSLVEEKGTKVLRMVNPSDVITKVPQLVMKNENKNNNINKDLPKKLLKKQTHDEKWKVGFLSDWIGRGKELTQWAYVELGIELTLLEQKPKRTKLGYLSKIIDLVTSHDLKTYLKLVKNCSSQCHLRSGARKMLHKNVGVTNDQRDNEFNRTFACH